MRVVFLGRRTSDTWGTIYPASGPRRENPTCCLYGLLLMMMYKGAVRDLVERYLSSVAMAISLSGFGAPNVSETLWKPRSHWSDLVKLPLIVMIPAGPGIL